MRKVRKERKGMEEVNWKGRNKMIFIVDLSLAYTKNESIVSKKYKNVNRAN